MDGFLAKPIPLATFQSVISAFRATMWRLATFYLLSIALMLAIVPWQDAGTDRSPFVVCLEIIGLPGGAAIINFVVLVAAVGVAVPVPGWLPEMMMPRRCVAVAS